MGCMLRSDEMSYYDIYVQPECAFEVFSRLGEMNCVQFEDMNTDVQPFQKRYITDVCRSAEMERKLRYMEDEMIKDQIYVPEEGNERNHKALQPSEMMPFELTLEKWETDIQEISSNHTKLMTHVLELTEMYYVLSHVGSMLGDAELRRDSFLLRKSELGSTGSLWVFTGVVLRSRCFHFEMMLWRVSSGNIFYRQAAEDKILMDTQTGQEVRKVAFLCICQGETLKLRLEKVCSGFRVNIYACPKTLGERMEVIDKLHTRLTDLEQVVKETSYHRCKALRTVGKQWRVWILQVRKAKAVYHTMNLLTLDITKKCLIGQCWVPDTDAPKVQEMLEEVSGQIGTAVPSFMSKSETTQTPPTYHRTNKFTRGFQNLINAYGNSTYREINPGLFTIITFPFLFSIMFADVGHGIIVMLFALWMIKIEKECMEKKSNNEIWNIFFGGRYIILLMGMFAIFTGVIFNEWFSRSVIFMSPHWRNNFTADQLRENEAVTLDPKLDTTSPYIFSVDPIWRLSSNKILFENSIKMKLSIIFGVIHMIFGLCMCVFNNLYFKHNYAIFLEFIPQFVFLVVLFLWLVFLIYYKWIFYSGISTDLKTGAGCAPQILIIFIDMVLMAETVAPEDDCDAYMFEGQMYFQRALVGIAGVCVPVMLFGPPVYKNYLNKKKSRMPKISTEKAGGPEGKETESEPFSEMMIHQAIHTIEYVLSTISHTASYLRLWALSLAHAQLSEMLWDMVLAKLALKKHHDSIAFVWIFVIFGVWAIFTLSILVLMEGLSAFLHTLRLHWVEFMSKFYTGTGYTFRPFSFSAILEGGDNKPESACAKKKKTTGDYGE